MILNSTGEKLIIDQSDRINYNSVDTFLHDCVFFVNLSHLPPINIITTEKTLSHLVLADTFPNPTVVKEVHE